MENLHIKLEVEKDSVLLQYASDKSLKAITEYPAEAYQPSSLGLNSVEEFIAWVTPHLTTRVKQRDEQEQSPLDLTQWEATSLSVEMVEAEGESATEVKTVTTEYTDPIPDQVELTYEQKVALVRAERNQLLTKSDWTQLPDSAVDKSAWATYRQGLRDLPSSLTQENINRVIYGIPPL